MKRLAFNGGEISPEMALRSDLDAFQRSCLTVENFDISQMGGISRRRGMRPFAPALPVSRLFSYEYSTQLRFLVEVGLQTLRVYTPDASCVYETPCTFPDLHSIRTCQLNALLLFSSPYTPLMQLRIDAAGSWSFSEFAYKATPWRYTDYRDDPITLSRPTIGNFSVSFPSSTPAVEQRCCVGDLLRISIWTDTQKASAPASSLLLNVIPFSELSPTTPIVEGTKIAIRSAPTIQYYSCIADWKGSGNDAAFVAGLTSPANYSGCFIRAEAISTASSLTPIRELSSSMEYKKGDMLAFESGYWEYYTCIKSFYSSDFLPGKTSPDDYQSFFIRGLAIGEALPCKGTWKFTCSGAWIGEYEVRRNRDTPQLSSEWTLSGSSASTIGANINTAITGDEAEEECYLRLFITRSYYLGSNIQDGFPADYCDNALIIDPYKHDILLRYQSFTNSDTTSYDWERVDRIPIQIPDSLNSKDWSWQAFSAKYGYPQLVETYGKRLVLAATTAQPVTIWMSKTDDLNNFELGKADDAALALTMASKTQNPICWLMSRSEKIYLGTTDSEHIIAPTSGKAATPTNLDITNHGYIGSANMPALAASDKIAYCERGSGRLYQFGYSYESDSYISQDLTVFSDHILRQGGGVIESAYIKKPSARAIFVLADGTLALMTYNSMHNINAWHRYTTQGTITSCAVIPNAERSDSLFFITQRDEGRFIETIDDASGYTDFGDLDYTSTISTTALTSPDHHIQKNNRPAIYFYLAQETQTEGIEISTDTTHWTRLDTTKPTLPKGWNQMIAGADWDWDTTISLRVSGDRPLHILAMQR